MSVYVDQAHKNNALRELARWLADGDKKGPARVVGAAEAFQYAAEQLLTILNTPVADQTIASVSEPIPSGAIRLDFRPGDLAVAIVMPLGNGEMQAMVYSRDDSPDRETITKLDRMIMRALLEHVEDQL